MSTPNERIGFFLAHLDSLTGGLEPRFYPLPSNVEGVPPVACMVYDDMPEPGMLTGVTYGLSEVEHPDWKLGRPELTITVRRRTTAGPWPSPRWPTSCEASARSRTATSSTSVPGWPRNRR